MSCAHTVRACALAGLFALGACAPHATESGRGAATGAAIGALGGAAIGSFSGDAGWGALAGAGAGAAGGYLAGRAREERREAYWRGYGDARYERRW